MQKVLCFGMFLLLFSACENSGKKQDIWTIDRCRDEGGLYIEAPSQKCKIQDREYEVTDVTQQASDKDGAKKTGKVSDGIIAALHDQNVSVEPLAEIENPLLGNSGLSLNIENEIVLVFLYSSDEIAEKEVQLLRNEGSTLKGLRMTWGSNVLYAQRGNEIAVYAGLSTRIPVLLEMAERHR